MIQFEERLSESAQRLAARDNKTLHVPANPLAQRRSYWGWVAAPAAAVAGIVLGLSMSYIAQDKPEIRYVENTDTICIDNSVHDTVYITQVVEKVKVVEKPVNAALSSAERNKEASEEEDTAACTSVQCDGINYAVLALN